MEWSPLCSDHVQRKDYCLFTGPENLRIFQTCLFTGGSMTENGSYKRNLLLKRRKKLLHQIMGSSFGICYSLV